MQKNPLLFLSSKPIVRFQYLGNNQTVLEIIEEVKRGLIDGLRSLEHATGWDDPTEESAQSLWTCVEVCKSLIESSEPIYNLEGILEKLHTEMIEVDGLKGWESESVPGAISTYFTSDVGLLYQSIGRGEELQTVLNTLYRMQNPDGGWGVCNGDLVSRTRSTGSPLRLYAKCMDSPWAFKMINWDSYSSAIDWLTKAQNDDDGGWGNLSDLMPSDLTATNLALNAILSSKIALRKYPNLKLPIRDSMIALGIKKLIKMGKNGSWRGVSEEFRINSPTAFYGKFRHTASGTGTLTALQVLCKAARLGYLKEDQTIIALGLNDIIQRSVSYSTANGKWLVPSDQNGPPTAWNSAFALDAFLEFQRLYLEYHTKGIVDVGLTSRIVVREKIWQSISVVLSSIIFFLTLAPKLTFLDIYVSWYNSQNAWTQGILITFIGIFTERIASFSFSFLRKNIIRDKKTRNE